MQIAYEKSGLTTKGLKVCRRIDYGIPVQQLQGPMDVGVLMEQFDDVAQRGLHRRVVRPHGRNRDEVDCRSDSLLILLFNSSRRTRSLEAGSCATNSVTAGSFR